MLRLGSVGIWKVPVLNAIYIVARPYLHTIKGISLTIDTKAFRHLQLELNLQTESTVSRLMCKLDHKPQGQHFMWSSFLWIFDGRAPSVKENIE